MKQILVTLVTLVFVIVAGSHQAFAAGFYIPEQGTAAMGQGEAVVARGDDPSTVFHNPAGIAQLEGTQFMLGATPIIPSTTFTNEGTEIPVGVPQPSVVGTETDTKGQVFFPPHFYFTHTHNNGVGVGLGLTTQFGIGTEWPSDWAARYISYDVDLKTYNVNPNIAVQIQPGWILAAGIDYVYSTVDLKNKVCTTFVPPFCSNATPDDDLHYKNSDGDGWGYNLGMLVKLTEKNTLGVNFRSPVKIHFEGEADFTSPVLGLPDTPAQTDITIPALASIGVANTSIPNLTLEFDLQWTGWSSFKTLNLDFANPAVADFSATKNWNDVLALRFGGEYRLNDTMALRLGYVHDPTPVPGENLDTLVPDADRHDFSIGLGAKFEKLTVDVAYMAVVFKDRKVDNTQNTDIPGIQYRLRGTFETLAHLAGVSLTYHY